MRAVLLCVLSAAVGAAESGARPCSDKCMAQGCSGEWNKEKMTIGSEPLYKLRWGRYCGMRHTCEKSLPEGPEPCDAYDRCCMEHRRCEPDDKSSGERREKCDDELNKCMDAALEKKEAAHDQGCDPATVAAALRHGNEIILKISKAFNKGGGGMFGGMNRRHEL
eukprot:TRINITY_DN51816_c0_g1_i1.p1 TRINITY_DN51816_c0_g1~~TRINITY_DN51816_c0_g1_i1.p1  ORF type:complete len:189 (+),score=50.52 TRINITY_DN51816_c0_g1_i1:73-567(+)